MLHCRGTLRLFPILGLAVAAACSEQPTVSGPDTPSRQVPQAQVTAPDQLTIARQVPGFGGFYLAPDGTPTAYLTDTGQRGLLEQKLGGWLRGLGFPTAQLNVVRGDYAYGQLNDWFSRVSPEALAVPGAVFADLDEAANRVTIGVENAAAAAGVRGVVARLGVPSSAVVIEQTEPIVYATSLRDRVRPVVAGLQINFSNYLCTLGFNATSGGVASFVTASHCTNTQGGVEGTLYCQPLYTTSPCGTSDPNYIAVEVADPTYFTFKQNRACPRGKQCRYSDSSREAYASVVTSTLGSIDQAGTSANTGSLTINGSFTITADNTGPSVVNTTVNKVGRTTGWTQGNITNTCVDTNVSGSNFTLLCQTWVSAGVGAGDSGSGVFSITSGTNVMLQGILWGGNSSGTTFVFSPFNQITLASELGPLTTH